MDQSAVISLLVNLHNQFASFRKALNLSALGSGGGAGKARFNVATPTNATVTCTAYVLPYNFQTKSI